MSSDILISDVRKAYDGLGGQPAATIFDGLSMHIKLANWCMQPSVRNWSWHWRG